MNDALRTDVLPRQAILIVNAMSRRGADVFDEARAKLLAAEVELIAAIAKAPMGIIGGGGSSWGSSTARLRPGPR